MPNQIKIIFLHCPKTGGCSISKMIGGSHSKIKNQNVIDGHRTIFYYEQKFKKLEDYLIFTIARNPWDRIVSCYHYVQNRLDKKFKITDIRGAFWLKTKNKTFEDFIYNLHEIHTSSGLGNILPSLKNKGPDPGLKNIVECISLNSKISVDFILNLHTLHEDWSKLSRFINVKTEVVHINKSNHEDYRSYYKNTKLIEIIEKIYKPDISYFNFKFDDKFYCDFDRVVNKNLLLDKKYI